MMDERLIGEVERHAIIYNRQKTNLFNGDKSANKEMAWLKIAHTLGTDGKRIDMYIDMNLTFKICFFVNTKNDCPI